MSRISRSAAFLQRQNVFLILLLTYHYLCYSWSLVDASDFKGLTTKTGQGACLSTRSVFVPRSVPNLKSCQATKQTNVLSLALWQLASHWPFRRQVTFRRSMLRRRAWRRKSALLRLRSADLHQIRETRPRGKESVQNSGFGSSVFLVHSLSCDFCAYSD